MGVSCENKIIMAERYIREEMRKEFSMDGSVDIDENYLYFNGGANRTYTTYSTGLVNGFIDKVKNKQYLHYPETDLWLYESMGKYKELVEGKDVLIIGSEEPCYEACALHYGAKKVMMVEYQKVNSDHPQIQTVMADEFSKMDEKYDVAISISSVEHSGLGRYGDPINPNGDIEAMKDLHNNLKEGGVCFLAVPIGRDQIIWNAHRVYGRERLPKLIEGFTLVESFGLIDSDYEVDEIVRRKNGKKPHRVGVSGGAHQPVLVLKKIKI